MYRYCRVLLTAILAMVMLSFGTFNLMRPGMAYASSHTAGLSVHSQGTAFMGSRVLRNARLQDCSADLGLGLVGSSLNVDILGFPILPLDPLSLANLQFCTP